MNYHVQRRVNNVEERLKELERYSGADMLERIEALEARCEELEERLARLERA